MAKRTHRDASDDAENLLEASHASSKRARTGSGDEEDAPQPQTRAETGGRTTKGRNKGKGRATAEDEDDIVIDEEDEQESEPELDEEEFERIHGQKLQKHLAKRQKVQGGIAEYGVVEYVEMTQFMCHKNLSFHFGPQINFIIGHNGSGKSAVLSAITVALGGKATSTGRGNGLKSFIREGQSVSEVTIHIKNQGEEAYRPKEYGKSIVITRRFTKDGSSTWKIRSKDGKLISSKKDELAAICDHMNIQVDNPMNVLTQDAARQFLSASKPEDKYQFFLRGTQLTQLSDEYQLCLDNISLTTKLLATKKEAIPDLVARLNAVNAKYQEASIAREQQNKVFELKKELAWAHVATKEDELKKAIGDVAKAARRLPKIEDNIQDAQVAIDQATEQVAAHNDEFEALESIEHLDERKAELQAEMKANKTKITDFNKDLKSIDDSVKVIKKEIEELDKNMEIESRRMAANTQSKRDETQAKINEGRTLVSNLETRLDELASQKRALISEADQIKAQGFEPERIMKECETAVREHDNNIASAKQRENDIYVPYGRNMKQVLDKIRSLNWHGEVPLGPLGLSVTAHDPKTWGDILRSQLGGLLISFGITDARDRTQLKRVLNEYGNTQNTVIVYALDLFDYRRGEPPENLLTVLRALDIKDPYVLRILINQAHIESQVLAPSRREAQETLERLRGGTAWSLDRMSVRVFPEGGVFSTPLNVRTASGAMSQLLTGRDAASDIQYYMQEKARHQNDYQVAWDICERLKKEFRAKKLQIETLNKEESSVQRQLRDARFKLNNLEEEASAELPAGLAGFQEAKKEAENEKALQSAQFETIMKNKTAVDAIQAKLLTELNQIKDQIAGHDEQRKAIAEKVAKAAEKRMAAQNSLKHYEAKLEEEKRAVGRADEVVKLLEKEFKNWTEEAQKVCDEPYPDPRKPDVVERSMESLKKALADRAKTSGASVEVMGKQLTAAQNELDRARLELRQMIALTKALKASVIIRLHRWEEFRRHIALRCKQIFQYHLSMRGYYGRILFDHNKGTLELRVKTDDQTQTQGTTDKDPKSLSGGEKSFSTICLLLSLWECIGCPLRCLDEFDVFMDAVNRRISMMMMIDTAKMSDKKQYILITPQDMSNIKITDGVRVLRMPDPERNEIGTLPFVSANAST